MSQEVTITDSNSTAISGNNGGTTPPTHTSPYRAIGAKYGEIIWWYPEGSGVSGYTSVPLAAGVMGVNSSAQGAGVQGYGRGDQVAGVRGDSNYNGSEGITHSSAQSGVFGLNDAGGSVPTNLQPPRPGGNGVWGHTNVKGGAGVVGSVDQNVNDPEGKSAGVVGLGKPGSTKAGWFYGDVLIDGTLTATQDIVLTGALTSSNGDCAEEFDIEAPESVEPGTVMVLNHHGALQPSQLEYDKKVAGVISGAGHYQPGLILDRQASTAGRMPVALVGKVYCKVDAHYAPIEMGDLLTTSPTPGHAMKATDPFRAFGAVIGKALRPLEAGQGLIPVLVAVQ